MQMMDVDTTHTHAAITPPTRQERKRRKVADAESSGMKKSSMSPAELFLLHPTGLCHFWMKQKHRYCTFPISPPSITHCLHHNAEETKKDICQYCKTPIRSSYAAHAASATVDGTSGLTVEPAASSSSASSSIPRVPRLTPMEAHHAICPKRRVDSECTKLPFYEKSVNGSWVQTNAGNASTADKSNASSFAGTDESSDDHAPISTKTSALQDVPRDELWKLIHKIKKLGKDLGVDEDFVKRTDAEAEEMMRDVNGGSGGFVALDTSNSAPLSAHSRQRHQLQHEGFFHLLHGHATGTDLLPKGSVVIEVGAGKAGLVGFLSKEVEAPVTRVTSDGCECDPEVAHYEDGHENRKRRKLDSHTREQTGTSTGTDDSAVHPAYTLIVLDRGSFKHKVDVAIRRAGLCELQRYRIDLQDLVLEKMPEISRSATSSSGVLVKTLVLGKHVCGQATDFVCKAVARANTPDASKLPSPQLSDDSMIDVSGASTPSSPSLRLISTICIATCCHQLCSWVNYPAQKWMMERGIGAREFTQMTRMSTWRTCGFGMHSETSNDPVRPIAGVSPSHDVGLTSSSDSSIVAPDFLDPQHPTFQLSAAEREHIGVICKHIFDMGRVAYLKDECGFIHAERRPYTTSTITKENFCILLA